MRTVPLTHQRVTIQDDFDLDKILESGQCFRPRKLADGRCRFVSGKALLYLTPLGCGQYDAAWYGADWDVWAGYFDLGRSYAALRQSLVGPERPISTQRWPSGRASGCCVRTRGRCSSPSSSPSAKEHPRPSAPPSSAPTLPSSVVWALFCLNLPKIGKNSRNMKFSAKMQTSRVHIG